MTPQKKTPAALAGAAGVSKYSELPGVNISDSPTTSKGEEISGNSPISWASSFIFKDDACTRSKCRMTNQWSPGSFHRLS